jgi:hypothetical protein
MDIKLDATSKQNPSPRPKIPGKSPKSEQRPRYTYVPYRYVKEKKLKLVTRADSNKMLKYRTDAKKPK